MARRKGMGKGQGKGFKNIIPKVDSRTHSLSARGIKKPQRMNPQIRERNIANIPYADKVRFYANPENEKIIVVQTNDLGKGWYEHRVGEHVRKSRSRLTDEELLNQFYPNYTKISLFTETSFHSNIFEKKSKIRNYGTKDYTLSFSTFKPIGEFRLQQPVRTQRKDKFGKVVNKLVLQEWNYVVLNWIPDDKIKLQIEHTISNPFTKSGEEKIIFKSKIYKLEDKKQAISDFKNYVAKIQKKR